MAYTLPTATELKARYPVFAGVSDALVDAAIADASRTVDDTWHVDDYYPAALNLAAHMLVEEGALLANAGDQLDLINRGSITSMRMGDASESYAKPGAGAGVSGAAWARFGTTIYGQRFLQLLRDNKRGPLVV